MMLRVPAISRSTAEKMTRPAPRIRSTSIAGSAA
jgi:hypothetical protein